MGISIIFTQRGIRFGFFYPYEGLGSDGIIQTGTIYFSESGIIDHVEQDQPISLKLKDSNEPINLIFDLQGKMPHIQYVLEE